MQLHASLSRSSFPLMRHITPQCPSPQVLNTVSTDPYWRPFICGPPSMQLPNPGRTCSVAQLQPPVVSVSAGKGFYTMHYLRASRIGTTTNGVTTGRLSASNTSGLDCIQPMIPCPARRLKIRRRAPPMFPLSSHWLLVVAQILPPFQGSPSLTQNNTDTHSLILQRHRSHHGSECSFANLVALEN